MKIYTFQTMIKTPDEEYVWEKVLRTSKREIIKARNSTIKKMKGQYKNYDNDRSSLGCLADDFDFEREDNILEVYEIKTFEIPINKQGILKAWKIGYIDME